MSLLLYYVLPQNREKGLDHRRRMPVILLNWVVIAVTRSRLGPAFFGNVRRAFVFPRRGVSSISRYTFVTSVMLDVNSYVSSAETPGFNRGRKRVNTTPYLYYRCEPI